MKITINDHRKIFAVQEEFNIAFPHLKLEFFSKSNKPNGIAGKKLIKQKSKTLGECRTIHNKGEITITPNMTIADLKQRFDDVYGLHVKVLKKAGKLWIEINDTEGWALEKQNKEEETTGTATA